MDDNNLILLTGATGYVGGRLLAALERKGAVVRCLVRRPEFLRGRVAPETEVVRGDVFDTASLAAALAGVHTAYYLVHSLAGRGSFAENDRLAARNFADAARVARVRRIIYLGGLGEGSDLSEHLASRQEVGEILRASGVPTTEFRASIIIGSGSLSYEMVRALVQKLPVMTTPQWVRSLAQPIAIEDVIGYLLGALDRDGAENRIFEIGGADVISYEGIMREYARLRRLKRIIIPVPLLSPWLSSLWLAFVTPLYFRVGRRLIEGVRNATVVTDRTALEVFPVRPMGIRTALERALANEDADFASTRWCDALASRSLTDHFGGIRFGSRLLESQEAEVACPAEQVFRSICRLGGSRGWYAFTWLWSLRGLIDQLLGGVGSRRGRPDSRSLAVGDTVGFLRVEALEPDSLLRLYAEMKMPGRAWLQYEVREDRGTSIVRQTALFDPIGLSGLVYWFGLYPVHRIVFRSMLRGIIDDALQADGSRTSA